MSKPAADAGKWSGTPPFVEDKTGLPSEIIFRDRLQQALHGAARHHNPLSVLVIEIIGADVVSTALSYTVGDVLLCALAERLSENVRKFDAVTRVGDGSFAVLLSNIRDATDAAYVAEKLLHAVSQPVQVADRDVCVSARVGITVYPGDGRDADTLIRHAQSAAQELRRVPRNAYQFYAPDLAARAAERLEVEADLRRAIAEGQFELHYQPTINTVTGEVLCAEALIRWNHPTKGLIPPAAFISIAERNGLIVDIGEWVASMACRDAREWQQVGHPPIALSINVSMRQLEEANIVETLMHCLVASNFDSQLLRVEVTESLFLRDPQHVKGVLERLREFGISIAIDDFGTGYSSLRQLMQLPIDTLKIDRSFVGGIPHDHDALVIVEAIAQLGRNLSINVVAEGVESAEQVEFLQEVGCHQCQGYLMGKPMRRAEFLAYLRGHREPREVPLDRGVVTLRPRSMSQQ